MRPQPESRPGEALPRGLVLFRPGTSPARRRRRTIFLAVYVLVAAMLVWPVYPRFSGIRPLILGLPLSLAWVVLALGVTFAALFWLFRLEDRD
jgi:hypothetical protein